ncbi:ferrous iron transport protein B [uncultured Phascolarctobacterium sp.]|uniref:ferrous iron transport protein B n=1 Tax=Phascolarctobacterium sp. TaxID=2049039 RepID=UPI0025CE97A2|nr:ferrous iron transport protein B [uncultured Phascolarctobacterium sp.]
MSKTLALVGNPNSGKTTLFNNLTGSKQYVGNWPGVTVERKGGKLKKHDGFQVMDLPGIYSLSPYSPEEVITRNYLLEEQPDVIVNIIDGSNLERNLYLTMQLLEMGCKVVVALNMMDLVRANGDVLDVELLSKELGCPVVPITATSGEGVEQLVERAVRIAEQQCDFQDPNSFPEEVERMLQEIGEMVAPLPQVERRWQLVKVLERDGSLLEKLQLSQGVLDKLEVLITRFEQQADDDAASIIATGRYQKIDSMLRNCYKSANADYSTSVSQKIDRIVTNRVLGLPIFLGIMWAVYYICIQTLGDETIGWMEELFEGISGYVGGILETAGASEVMTGLVLDGIIGGVGAVLGFVPQIMLLFLFLSFLEDCGYMARVAFIMDRIFRQFGLSGKSFIPMLIGTGCSVPGIMAARTIENERDRKLTIMLTPFIPCNAKLPVFALFAAAFFPEQSWVGPSMYLWGMAMVVISGIVLKQTKAFAGEPANFVMELPAYHWPRVKDILIHTWERARGFIVKAGTIIFLASGLVWLLQSFNFSFEMVEAQDSMMASIGHMMAPVFAPLGFDSWQTAFAAITGFLAKEVVVSTFGVLAGVAEATEEDPTLITTIQSMFTPASAYAFMIFTLLASPCFAAIGAIRREMGSWHWTLFALLYQTGLAYCMALLIYQIGSRM